MKFLVLTRRPNITEDRRLIVSMHNVIQIRASDSGGSVLDFPGGHSEVVIETLDQIIDLLNQIY